jgi:hypothetical protein
MVSPVFAFIPGVLAMPVGGNAQNAQETGT